MEQAIKAIVITGSYRHIALVRFAYRRPISASIILSRYQMGSPLVKPPRGVDFSKELAQKGWYHSFELSDGTVVDGCMPLSWQRQRYEQFTIPDDLTGKRLLDIGAWDGWFSFEAERHGAEVIAVDCVEVPHFLEIHRKLGSKVDYRILDFYQLPKANLGTFDFVFFLGVLYHVRHPLLALEIVCALATDTVIVESFVTDADTWADHCGQIPSLEFYETNELGNQMDNWFGPTVDCLMAMCRAAGFVRVELLSAAGATARVACHRKWEPMPIEAQEDPPEAVAILNSRTAGINFSTQKDEYISCWFRTPRISVLREHLRLEVAGFGVPALFVSCEGERTWVANFRLPPGLECGWTLARLRFAETTFGGVYRIAIDMPPKVDALELVGVTDGITWTPNNISVGKSGYLSCWVRGLPENCDRNNVEVYLGDARLPSLYVGHLDGEGNRQINAEIGDLNEKSHRRVTVECGGVRSNSVLVTVT